MTPRNAKLSRASVLALATGAATTRARGASSSVRQGASFEDVVEAVWKTDGWCQRGHPETKMIPTPQGRKLVHVGRNGVDYVGVYARRALAVECKRLPGAASLRGAKDDSTAAEALWLSHFGAAGGVGAFLIYDPDAKRLYVVEKGFETVALGGLVPLRERDGVALVVSWDVKSDAMLAEKVRLALRWIAT